MTKEEAIGYVNTQLDKAVDDADFMDDEMYEALQVIVKIAEQEPCEDAVSRQAVDQNIYDYAESNGLSYANLKNAILDTPSVTPTTCVAKVIFDKDDLQELVDEKVKELTLTRKKGKWILIDEESNTWKCTNCIKEGKDDWWQLNHRTPQDNKMSYCPHCGADMRGADNETN